MELHLVCTAVFFGQDNWSSHPSADIAGVFLLLQNRARKVYQFVLWWNTFTCCIISHLCRKLEKCAKSQDNQKHCWSSQIVDRCALWSLPAMSIQCQWLFISCARNWRNFLCMGGRALCIMQLQSWLAANPTKLPAAAAAHLTSANIAQARLRVNLTISTNPNQSKPIQTKPNYRPCQKCASK